MGKHNLSGKDLKQLAFPHEVAKSISVNLIRKHGKHKTKEELLALLSDILAGPDKYLEDPVWYNLAKALTGKVILKNDYQFHELKREGYYNIFGERNIQETAKLQMEAAMRLPVAVKGALMPDAHHGYGLPIGAALATDNAVIPYGVGMDIGCRMALSIYAQTENFLERKISDLKKALEKFTHFGNEGGLPFGQNHEVLDREEFQATAILKRLHGKAWEQLGTSRTGNHFVEFGLVELHEGNQLNVPSGRYLGLLSHSGSRGMGAALAANYTKIAMDRCKLPRELQHMAWLDLNDEAGQEYWLSMNLAGDYAKACHDRIHHNLEKVLGLDSLIKIENHHNFAWKEIHDGREVIVHRKGATPAAEGELGIIPGSMTSPGFIVRGKGNKDALNSASHGAGRRMSRKEAREKIAKSHMHQLLQENKVTLIGGSTEEAPLAYKDIHTVMQYHDKLVDVEGVFYPRVVRMNKS